MGIFYRRNSPAGGLSFLGEADIINSPMEPEPLSAPTELTYPQLFALNTGIGAKEIESAMRSVEDCGKALSRGCGAKHHFSRRKAMVMVVMMMMIVQPCPQDFSLKKWVGRHPFFEAKALGTRLYDSDDDAGVSLDAGHRAN